MQLNFYWPRRSVGHVVGRRNFSTYIFTAPSPTESLDNELSPHFWESSIKYYEELENNSVGLNVEDAIV